MGLSAEQLKAAAGDIEGTVAAFEGLRYNPEETIAAANAVVEAINYNIADPSKKLRVQSDSNDIIAESGNYRNVVITFPFFETAEEKPEFSKRVKIILGIMTGPWKGQKEKPLNRYRKLTEEEIFALIRKVNDEWRHKFSEAAGTWGQSKGVSQTS